MLEHKNCLEIYIILLIYSVYSYVFINNVIYVFMPSYNYGAISDS
jgi:hypothetical protein